MPNIGNEQEMYLHSKSQLQWSGTQILSAADAHSVHEENQSAWGNWRDREAEDRPCGGL